MCCLQETRWREGYINCGVKKEIVGGIRVIVKEVHCEVMKVRRVRNSDGSCVGFCRGCAEPNLWVCCTK